MPHKFTQQFDNIYIEKESLNSYSAKRAFQIFPKSRIHIIENKSDLNPSYGMNAAQFDKSKKNLLLSSFKGKFFKRCPGARPGLICCNYFVLNLGQHCEMDCSYCYLQNFINFPYVTIYTNIEKALEELDHLSHQMNHQKLRIGTGEITDSLSLDDLTHYSVQLVNYFKNHPQWTLEFKTKSNNVKNFVKKKHIGNIIVSWSINPQYIVEKEEHGTASSDERLQAARLCSDNHFPIAFHLDPIIYHKNWKHNYAELIRQITSLFQPHEVSHLSLGALRFQPEQRHLMRERFGMDSLITRGEYFKSQDGKLRYSNQLRGEMFHFITSEFKKHSSQWNLFLCMENKENWFQSLGNIPWKIENIQNLFHQKSVLDFKRYKENPN